MALGLNACGQNMFAKRLALIVFKADKDSTMASPGLGPVADLIEDQLETEQADLTHSCPTLFLNVPILRESKLLSVEAQRALSILDEKDTSGIEIIHILCAPIAD